ncbi:MAG TPA: L-histidine N(alpha)-methyltransferase [Usitatibacter sp.]|nr:L-histidine N(alpha)-methyltransferase [Usitatibacter sp.]
MPDTKPIHYRLIDRSSESLAAEREAVVVALLDSPARISPKYFYDELGCALYGAICELPEYYPTRTEMAIFQAHRAEIAEAMGQGRQFVDLGAGDCRKAQAWLPFVNPKRYIAVDIAATELERSLARMSPDFPEIEMLGVIEDFSRGLALEGVLDATPATFFYPGSSIGNFTPEQALHLLRGIRAQAAERAGSSLVIGVDAKKAKSVLDGAYDDRLGVTAAFNRNALLHLNRRFGFDFALEGFEHRAFYDERLGRIEMHLQARGEQTVQLGSRARRFAPGERIHTENSYKYEAAEFEKLLRRAGFGAMRLWASPDNGYFVFFAA